MTHPQQEAPAGATEETGGMRQAIVSTGLLSGASLANLAIGIVRAKACALLLGPPGIAIVGVLGALLQGMTTAFGLGLRGGGVRALAVQDADVPAIRRVLYTAHLSLGLTAAILAIVFQRQIAIRLFGDDGHAVLVACTGLGTLLMLAGTANTTVLQGLRKVRQLAICGSTTTLVGSSLAIAAVWVLGFDGLWLFVLSMPLASAVISGYLVRKAAPSQAPTDRSANAWPILLDMLPVGAVFMVGAVLPVIARLWVVSSAYKDIGPTAAGVIQVTWTISLQYVGLVLTGLAADYYPRLSAAAPDALEGMVNRQARVGLLFGAPLIAMMIALADYVVPLLYSHRFSDAIQLVRLNLLGDVFRLVSWPLGFVLLARRRATTFLATQATWFVLLVGGFHLSVATFGPQAAAASYVFACMAGAAIDIVVARRSFGVRLSGRNALFASSVLLAIATIVLLSSANQSILRLVAFAAACTLSIFCMRELVRDFGGDSAAISFARRLFRIDRNP